MIRMSRPSKSEDDSAFVFLDHLEITMRSKVTQSMEKHGIKLDGYTMNIIYPQIEV